MDRIAELSKNMDNLAALFTSKLAHFEKSIPPAPQDNSTLVSEFNEFKSFIMAAVSNLKAQIELIYLSLEDIEMRSRSNILLLHGLPEKKDESLIQVIASVCNDKLLISNATASALKSCHRLGKNAGVENPRPVLIRFSNNDARHEVWLAKRKLKGTGLTLSEFLTPVRHALFLEARKALGVKDCWTMDGRIVAVCPDGKRKKIGSKSDLEFVISLRGTSTPQSSKLDPSATSSNVGEDKSASGSCVPATKTRNPNPPRAVRNESANRGAKAPKTK
ncbi:hypothetical protein NE865_04134 [Phthorimaea operculella]|nr:hypothetical protein NE865_04134 [Phthorimaea operculella]